MAHENGADSLMVLPPAFFPAGQDEVVAYYRAISDAVPLPIFIQDVATSPIAPGLAKRLAQECEWVQYIKVESFPVVAKVAAMAEEAGDDLTVFSGERGAAIFIEEMRRGSVGTMPFCTQPEAFVDIWDRVRSGDEAGAWETFNRFPSADQPAFCAGSGPISWDTQGDTLSPRCDSDGCGACAGAADRSANAGRVGGAAGGSVS